MATPAQAAAATVGAGSLAAAGAYGITQAVNGNGEETNNEDSDNLQQEPALPNVTTFTETESFTGEPYNNKLITLLKTTNLPYLVKPENNDQWWSWAFENKFPKDKQGIGLDTLFSNVNNSEDLKTACLSSYKSEKTSYSFASNNHLLKNISDYCTKDRTPFDISEPKSQVYGNQHTPSNGYKTGVLSISSNASVLVKKENTNDNKYWWIWAYEKLYKPHNSDVDNVFKNTTITKDFTDSGTDSLNHACDEAYKKTYSDLTTATNKLLKNIKQFCSTDRTEELLKLPEPNNPTLIASGDSTYGNHKLVSKNYNKLVNPDNSQEWWNWIFQNKYPKTPKEKAALPDPFKHVTSGHSTTAGNENNQPALNQACKVAYNKDKSSHTQNPTLITKVKEFCSPSSTEGDLTQPDS